MQSYSSNGLVDSNPMSEDCLSVNILSPAGLAGNADAKLPVFVWIYGGGFTTGAGSYYVSPYFVSYGAQTVSRKLLL
jgi:carboxylesterase type B